MTDCPGLYEYYGNVLVVLRVSEDELDDGYIIVEGIMTGPLRPNFRGLEDIVVNLPSMRRL